MFSKVGEQSSIRAQEIEQHENEEEDVEEKEAAGLTFSAPEALLRPFPANPLRIFVRLLHCT